MMWPSIILIVSLSVAGYNGIHIPPWVWFMAGLVTILQIFATVATVNRRLNNKRRDK